MIARFDSYKGCRYPSIDKKLIRLPLGIHVWHFVFAHQRRNACIRER